MKEKKQKQTAEVAAETQTAKSGKKSFLQLILFIALSLAGFVVQMVIEQVGERIDAIKICKSTERPILISLEFRIHTVRLS